MTLVRKDGRTQGWKDERTDSKKQRTKQTKMIEKKKGTSPSGKQNVPSCTSWKKGSCAKGNNCDFWHATICRFWTRNLCSLGEKCDFAHVDKFTGEGKPSAPRRPARQSTPSQAQQDAQSDKTVAPVYLSGETHHLLIPLLQQMLQRLLSNLMSYGRKSVFRMPIMTKKFLRAHLPLRVRAKRPPLLDRNGVPQQLWLQ